MWWIQRPIALIGMGRIIYRCKTAAAAAAAATAGDSSPSLIPLEEVPGPRCYPLVGSLFDMIFDKEFDKEKTHLYFKKLFQKYGPVVRIKLPGKPTTVILYKPEDIKTILQVTMNNPVRIPTESLKKARYSDDYYEKKAGVVSENGEEWSRLTSLLRPKVMRLNNLHNYLPQMDQVALDFLQRISTLRNSTGEITVDFKEELEKWSLESVCLISLNQRVGALEPSLPCGSEPELIIRAARNVMSAIRECETDSKLWKFYPTNTFKLLQYSLNKLKETCDGVLDEVQSEMLAKLERDPSSRLTMVEQLLIQPGLTRKDIITFMIDLIAGGTETMTELAVVVLYLLAKNPHAQAQVQEELDHVLGDGTGPLTPHHLDQLSYVKAVIKEANRVLPPTLGPVRILQEDVRLRSFVLQKGWMTFLMTAFSGWDEAEFERPQEFLPERWLRHRPCGTIHPYASLPFSFGTRMCIGRRIAEQEIYTFVARTFHRYNVEWRHGELERLHKFVFSPKGPLRFTFIDR